MAYTVSDGTNTFPLAELEISYTGIELDEAQFTIAGVIALDATVTIYSDTTVQFLGYVKEVEEIEQGALYKYTAYEKAVELKTMPYLSSTLDIFTKTSTTVANHITDILTSTPDSGWTLASGMADTTSLTINFYMVNRLQAINKILREMRGYYVLFDSSAKTVKFLNGTGINTDRSTTDIVYITKTLISSSMLRGITQVVVIGKDSSVRGTYGSSTSSRAYYQVDDITSNDEALKIATAIHGDIGVTYAKYKVTVDPSQIQYDVRDKVQVDSVDYWVTDVLQSMDDIVLTIDDGRTSVIDSLGNRIHKIDGNFPEGTDAQWSGGNTNVAANYAATTSFIFDVKDVAMITNAKIDATIGAFIKSATVSANTERLSDVSNIQNTTTYTGSSTAIGYGSWNLPDGTQTQSAVNGIDTTLMTDGYQFAMLTFAGNFLAGVGYPITFQWIMARAADSASPPFSWTAVGAPFTYTTPTGAFEWLSYSTLISGSSSTESTSERVIFALVITGTANQYKTSDVNFIIQRVPRHLHSVTTTYDKTTTGTPPSTVYVNVNANGENTLTPGTPLDIQSWLITGKNIILIKTPMTAGNQCSVNPTITYQTLGKS